MRQPLFVRPFTNAEQQLLDTGLRSADAFVLRRCQILLASARGQTAITIAQNLGCDDQTVRNVIHAFNATGVVVVQRGSSRPHTTPHSAFDPTSRDRLRARLHQSPRTFAKPTSVWTLALAAEVAFAQGITPRKVSGETIRAALKQVGVSWKRAKHWITSPDPDYLAKKRRRDRLIRLAVGHPTWAVGFADEVWWSRLAQPDLHTWGEEDERLRLQELQRAKDDRAPKALACYGLLVRRRPLQSDQMLLRFVDGRPVSTLTIDFLAWCSERLAAQGISGLLLIWDNASWHKSQAVRSWICTHNQTVKQTGQGVRIVVCLLPSKSPWLNPIEPKWVHGKRAVVEPDRLLSAQELEERVCSYFGCAVEEHLTISEKVA